MDEPDNDTEDVKTFNPITDDAHDTEPDPDESIMLDSHENQMWMVKIPKFLMKRWASIDEDNVHLATIRVYDNKDPVTGKQRMMVLLPEHTATTPEAPSRASPAANGTRSASAETRESTEPEEVKATEFELEVINDVVDNQVVIAEKEKVPGGRARSTIRTGRVRHECNLQPVLNSRYRRLVKDRVRVANTPLRTIQIMEEVASQASINRMASGVPTSMGTYTPLRPPKLPKSASGQFERFARIPKNQLLDALFALFAQRSHWSIKDLRAKTQQPEAYLKEVLSEVAQIHRIGDKVGLWSLKSNFAGDAANGEGSGTKMEDVQYSSDVPGADDDAMDDDDDDDDDDEMEEIS